MNTPESAPEAPRGGEKLGPRHAGAVRDAGSAGPPAEDSAPSTDFIRKIVQEDLRTNKFGGRVQTRFPPEPNGYLHIEIGRAHV